MMSAPDPRYRARLRSRGHREDDRISMDIFEHDSEMIGTWDTLEKGFVKRNEKGEWVPE